MPAKMKMCFDTGNVTSNKVYRQDNSLPIKTSLATFGMNLHTKEKRGSSNFMNVAVLKKTKGGCGACGSR